MNDTERMKYDYIITGQGLAGTVLAHQFLQRGKKILILDDPGLSSSSKVAAGLFNPVVFKRLVKSWMAEEQLAFATGFYTAMEALLDDTFYYYKDLVKIFAEDAEKALWDKKRLEDVGKYLSPIYTNDNISDFIEASRGYAFVHGAGNLDVPKFLSLSSRYFKSLGILLEERMDYSLLDPSDSGIVYKSYSAPKLIFCEGHLATANPWFSWMPFNLAKGEVLTVKIPGYTFDKVVNKGVFILPLGNSLFRVGSTFAWEQLDEVPTEAGRLDLIQRLEKVLKLPYEIIDHRAGIRPTVINRRPLIGIHPQHPALCVFNGMGSKGVMIAPLFADHFIRHLEEQTPLSAEVDIRRFYKS
jgi:glycine oxidase